MVVKKDILYEGTKAIHNICNERTTSEDQTRMKANVAAKIRIAARRMATTTSTTS